MFNIKLQNYGDLEDIKCSIVFSEGYREKLGSHGPVHLSDFHVFNLTASM